MKPSPIPFIDAGTIYCNDNYVLYNLIKESYIIEKGSTQ